MDEPIVFQATNKYRIQYALAWIAAVLLTGVLVALILFQNFGWLATIFFLLLSVGPLIASPFFNWKPPGKIKFSLSAEYLSGTIGNRIFQIPFSKILHIENLGHALRIDATDSQHLLEKRHFDLEQIQVELKKRLHPDVFVNEGWMNLPAYQPIQEQIDAMLAEISTKLPLRVKQENSILFKVLIVVTVILFLAATVFSWQQLGFGSLLFLFFVVLGVIILLRKGVWEIDSHQISYETRFKKYRILWENVNQVEHDDQLAFAFIGQNQCLKIPWSHEFRWEHKQRELFYFFLDHTIELKNIERRRSQWASVRFNKNTRVPK